MNGDAFPEPGLVIDGPTELWFAQELPDIPEPGFFASDILDPASGYCSYNDDILLNQAIHFNIWFHDIQFHDIPDTELFFPEIDVPFGNNTLNQPNVMAGMDQVENILGNSTDVDPYSTTGVVDRSQAYPSHFVPQESFSADNLQKDTPGPWTGSSKQSEVRSQESYTAKYKCDQCLLGYTSASRLSIHYHQTGHLSYACKHDNCDKKFSRLDTYRRHERKHRDDAKRFPCMYCKKYRGSKGFKRRDHLTQHVRNYHHIVEDDPFDYGAYHARWCPYIGCSHHKEAPHNTGKPNAFSSSAELIKHIRTIHDDSDLPCQQPGCDRVNGKGYFRKADLRNHLRKVHGTDGSLGGDKI